MSAEGDELALVMSEILTAMDGRSIALSLHPHGEGPASIVCAANTDLARDGPKILTEATNFAEDMHEGETQWRGGFNGAGATLLIPVEAVPGHSRLVISVGIGDATPERRTFAEGVYRTRKPFAVGYFRLWQANRALALRCRAYGAALDMTELGVLLIDQAGDITFANDAGERVLAAGAGIRRVGRSLRATDLAEGVRLQVALNHVTALSHHDSDLIDPEPASILALQRKAGPPLIVSLTAPRVGHAEPTDVAAIMFIVDPQLDTARILEPVCRLYRLSPVETKLVSHLAQGRSLSHASELMRVKEQTARSYMKQIFVKTTTNRQSELIVLMLSSVVRMRSGLAQKALSAPEGAAGPMLQSSWRADSGSALAQVESKAAQGVVRPLSQGG